MFPVCNDSSAFSEASSQTSGSSGAVNRVERDIEKMNINDPDDESSVSRDPNERRTKPDPSLYRGLLNQGATCYLNATLQVLFMTPAFRDAVLRAPGDTCERVESALKKLFGELSRQDRDAPSVSTKPVTRALGIERVREQQDAVEYFLDILEKVGPGLAEVFRGTMRNLRRCSEHHESHDDSDFKSIQIALDTRDGPYTLEDGVRSYFASTKLVGDDQVYCEDCDEKRDTIWSCEIHEYPAALALHLKRFVYDHWSGRFVKNDCPVDVPLQLRLGEQEYRLYAVINHSGSRHGGHYTADIRPPTGDQWYCFNDSHVSLTDERKLKGSSEAYLLLYQKTPSVDQVEDVEEEPEAEETGEAVRGRVAHNTPQLEVSVVTGRLRILVLGRPETDQTSLAQKIRREVGFSCKSQLRQGQTITDSLKICRPGPHVILWVAPLDKSEEDIHAFEETYRFLGNTASKYMMMVFTSKSRPTGNIRTAARKYRAIRHHHVLDLSAELNVQVKRLVSKLREIIDQNEEHKTPYYDQKPRRIKHKKTGDMREKEPENESHDQTTERGGSGCS